MGSLSGGSEMRPHAVCVPCPAQGHVNPMMKLAKILHSRGFHITFVNNEYNHKRLLRARGPGSLDGLPSFRFEAIPDGLPPTDDCDCTQHVPDLCRAAEENCLAPFRDLLARLNRAEGVPPVTCIVSDSIMFFALDAAEELGVPGVLFWTASACGLLGYSLYDKLIASGIVPFKDANFMTNGGIDMVVDWVPAIDGIRLRDVPSFVRTTDPDEFLLHFANRMVQRQRRAKAIIFNTFDALERESLRDLAPALPPVYTLGPLHLLQLEQADDKATAPLGSNLWKEDPRCLEWLDKHRPGTVVYVNYGSVTVMSSEQLVEFAWGLANTGMPFLWITRPDLVTGEPAALPPGFLEETRGRGLIASWCNQERVLAHPAVGGFLTHSGWNSTLESVCSGVPMICWPFFAEQQTNCWYCCKRLGVAMEIDVDVKRVEVERQVRELMGGEQGREMKRKAVELKALAHEAVASPRGASYTNLNDLISNVLLS